VGNEAWKSHCLLELFNIPGSTSPASSTMPGGTRFEPSSIKNKIKREEVARKAKKAKNQQKLQKRLAQAKSEATNPAAKKVSVACILFMTRNWIE
jgi:hypothetical protein